MTQHAPQVYEINVRTTPERLWQSLTDPELTQQYYFGTRVESDWQPGSPVRYRNQQGGVDLKGEVLEADPPRRLVTTFRPTWAPDMAGGSPSTVRWEITPDGDTCKLTLTHEGLDPASPGADQILQAWQPTLSALKSALESG